MIPERHMKQAKWIAKDEMVRGYLFYMHCDTVAIPCIAIGPLTANNYGEIHSFCYCEVDPDTIEDVAVKPIFSGDFDINCPNCGSTRVQDDIIGYKFNCCADCGQRIDWQLKVGD